MFNNFNRMIVSRLTVMASLSYTGISQYSCIWNVPRRCVLGQIKQLAKPASRLLTTQQQQQQQQQHCIERSQWRDEAILYVHWPYCKKKCNYCNFNKYVVESIDHDRIRNCLVKETETLLNSCGVKSIKSVFFGGGTPSLAEPCTIENVLKAVTKCTHLLPDAEITLEANPTSAESSKLREFKGAGINRLSLGVQSLIDEDLQVLGRQHSVSEALNCLEIAKSLFPGRTSIDIIFGRPGQKLTDWKKELDQILSICDDHLSLYQLTLEKGTVLFKQVMDRALMLPSLEMIDDMYEVVVEKTGKKGFHRYEVSNFAKHQGSESVHNKGYWHSTQYIGVGPGAHGRFIPCGAAQREARVQTLVPDKWMSDVERSGHGTQKIIPQSEHTVLQEVLMLGMRTASGVSNKIWQIFTDSSLQEVFGEARMVGVLKAEGYIEFNKDCLRATSKGLNVADGLTKELINILDMFLANR